MFRKLMGQHISTFVGDSNQVFDPHTSAFVIDTGFVGEHHIWAARWHVAWTVGTSVGVLSHVVVEDVERLGLDVVFPAFCLAVLMRELRSGGRRMIAATVIAAALAAALVPISPPGVPVLAACGAALLGLKGRSS